MSDDVVLHHKLQLNILMTSNSHKSSEIVCFLNKGDNIEVFMETLDDLIPNNLKKYNEANYELVSVKDVDVVGDMPKFMAYP